MTCTVTERKLSYDLDVANGLRSTNISLRNAYWRQCNEQPAFSKKASMLGRRLLAAFRLEPKEDLAPAVGERQAVGKLDRQGVG